MRSARSRSGARSMWWAFLAPRAHARRDARRSGLYERLRWLCGESKLAELMPPQGRTIVRGRPPTHMSSRCSTTVVMGPDAVARPPDAHALPQPQTAEHPNAVLCLRDFYDDAMGMFDLDDASTDPPAASLTSCYGGNSSPAAESLAVDAQTALEDAILYASSGRPRRHGSNGSGGGRGDGGRHALCGRHTRRRAARARCACPSTRPAASRYGGCPWGMRLPVALCVAARGRARDECAGVRPRRRVLRKPGAEVEAAENAAGAASLVRLACGGALLRCARTAGHCSRSSWLYTPQAHRRASALSAATVACRRRRPATSASRAPTRCPLASRGRVEATMTPTRRPCAMAIGAGAAPLHLLSAPPRGCRSAASAA